MTRPVRGFVAVSLAALIVAAVLHVLLALGWAWAWPALVHVTICGWITAMIVAVNYHVLPVFSARSFPYPRLLDLHLALFPAGLAVATIGWLGAWQTLIVGGLALEILASLVFASNTVLLFRRGPRRAPAPPTPPFPAQRPIDRLGTHATRSAGMALPIALTLLLAQQVGWIGAGWLLAAEHLLTLGWIMLMIVGVALHVLPRFSGRQTRGAAWARAEIGCHLLALVLIVTALGLGWPSVFALGGALMALALTLFAATIWPTLVAIRPRRATIALMPKERRP